ncbi:MAG: alpha/beta fold hydrolase [Candidatus Bathyarchaeia archaeon]|nr:alpha/beta fold hydrolase [Candidatus Bathyarchaeota archaeon]
MIKPVSFTNHGQQLVGILHVPDNLFPDQKAPAIAMFHGFTGHKSEAHRFFVQIARALCKAGFVVLRFDFRGSGDSDGDFEDMTVPGEVSDAEQALTFLSSLPEVDDKLIGVIGLSMGGRVASILASKDNRVKYVVLYSAALAPLKQMFEGMVRSEKLELLKRGESVSLNNGWYLKKPFFDTLDETVPYDVMDKIKAPVLIVHGDSDQTVPLKVALRGYEIIKGLNDKNKLHIVKGGDHVFTLKEHTAEVIKETVDWLKSLDLKAIKQKEEEFTPSIDYSRPWFHGSPLRLGLLKKGSTITQDEELARVFSHAPTIVSVSDEGTIKHDGKRSGFLYRIAEDVFPEDVQLHPHSSLAHGKEWITTRDLRVAQIGVTFIHPKEILTSEEISRLKKGRSTTKS